MTSIAQIQRLAKEVSLVNGGGRVADLTFWDLAYLQALNGLLAGGRTAAGAPTLAADIATKAVRVRQGAIEDWWDVDADVEETLVNPRQQELPFDD